MALFLSCLLPPLHLPLVAICSLLSVVIPGPGHTPPRSVFHEPPEPGFYSFAAPARPELWSSWSGSPRGPACHPREQYLTLWNRQGFIHLALRHRAQALSSPAQTFEDTDFVALPDVGSSGTRDQTPVPCIEPLWCPCTPLERMTSSELRLLPQTPGSICSRSPSRRSWTFLLASSGAVVSSQPGPGSGALGQTHHHCGGPPHPGAPVPAAHRGAGGPLSHALHKCPGATV